MLMPFIPTDSFSISLKTWMVNTHTHGDVLTDIIWLVHIHTYTDTDTDTDTLTHTHIHGDVLTDISMGSPHISGCIWLVHTHTHTGADVLTDTCMVDAPISWLCCAIVVQLLVISRMWLGVSWTIHCERVYVFNMRRISSRWRPYTSPRSSCRYNCLKETRSGGTHTVPIALKSRIVDIRFYSFMNSLDRDLDSNCKPTKMLSLCSREMQYTACNLLRFLPQNHSESEGIML